MHCKPGDIANSYIAHCKGTPFYRPLTDEGILMDTEAEIQRKFPFVGGDCKGAEFGIFKTASTPSDTQRKRDAVLRPFYVSSDNVRVYAHCVTIP